MQSGFACVAHNVAFYSIRAITEIRYERRGERVGMTRRKTRMRRSLEIPSRYITVHNPRGAHLREPVLFFDSQPVAEIRHDDQASPQDVAQLHGVLETAQRVRRLLRDKFNVMPHGITTVLWQWHTGGTIKWGVAAAPFDKRSEEKRRETRDRSHRICLSFF